MLSHKSIYFFKILSCFAFIFSASSASSFAKVPLEQLLKELNEPRKYFRDLAVEELARRKAIKPLVKALNYGNDVVRNEAARSLGLTKDSRAVEPLIAALGDPDVNVRWSIVRALRRLGDKRAVNPVIIMLNDIDHHVRTNAAGTLGFLKDTKAVPYLIRLMQRDPSALVRTITARALGRLGDVRAIPYLKAALRDKSKLVRDEVMRALRKFKK